MKKGIVFVISFLMFLMFNVVNAVSGVKSVIYNTAAKQAIYDLKGHQCADTEVRDYIRNGNNVTMVRKRYSGGVAGSLCEHHVLEFTVDAEGVKHTGMMYYDTLGVLIRSFTFDESILIFPAVVNVGDSWASGSKVTQVFGAGTGTLSTAVEKSTLVKENLTVSVPAGTFTGCVKLVTRRVSGYIAGFDRVDWYCPTVGLVKRISHVRIFELSVPPVF